MIPSMAVTKKRVSKTKTLPAPIGGLNARDGLANMSEKDAVIMENWFPETTSVDIRKGYVEHATGLSEPVDSLVTYNNGVTQELFAIADGNVFDVTTSGAVGSAEVTGLSNSRFQYINFGTAGGFFLLMVNGADKLQGYNGTSWYVDGDGTADITGVDTADIINVNNFKNRVWLIEKDSLNAWYLPVSSIGGAANKLDLSGLFKLGGYLVTMANWTIDNAAGIDDYAAFITSEGEVALYKGTDPSSSTTWALVGTFRVGKPIGLSCAIKAGADVLILTEDGALPLSKALLTDRGQKNIAVTDKISQLFLVDSRDYKTAYGWQPIIHPIGNKLIINVPTVESSISHQYVMNIITKAWTKYTGWNAFCFAILNDKLYFGGDGFVYEADTGFSDNDQNIKTDVQQAYNYFGRTGVQKRFTMARPLFEITGNITPSLKINVDYADKTPSDSPSYSEGDASAWDVAVWDEAEWSPSSVILKNWRSISGVGYSAGIRIKTTTKNNECRWQSTDIVYEEGGTL